MATASSAQREPSMEEILASIRRIIEDSDSGRKQADEAIESSYAIESDEDEAGPPVVDAFRSELRTESTETRPTMLADVRAGLSTAKSASAPDDSASPAAITLAEVGARLAAEQAGTADEAANADVITADWQRDIAVAGRPSPSAVQPAATEPERSAGSSANEAAEEPEFSRGSALQAEPIQPASTDEMPARSALVSEQTSRQVAAAFGELSEAFASRSRKSFDEMAEDMLRPMLQDWLDNNLPTLVERLVREEIERVARGG